MRCTFVTTALFLFLMCACGASDKPIQQPEQPPLPKDTTPASPAKVVDTTTSSSQNRYDVDFVEAKPSEPIKNPPIVQVNVPGIDQVIPSQMVASTRVRYVVKGLRSMPEGSYIQFVLDGKPYNKRVMTTSEQVMLSELAGEEPLAQGGHTIAAFACGPNNEAVKHEKSLSLHRFYVGKKTRSNWDLNKDPQIIVTSPHGTYSSDVLVDWYLINASLGKNQFSLRVSIDGPGIKPDGIQRVITEWRPWVVLSAHDKEEYSIRFELLDPNGELVPNGVVTRKFKMERDS